MTVKPRNIQRRLIVAMQAILGLQASSRIVVSDLKFRIELRSDEMFKIQIMQSLHGIYK